MSTPPVELLPRLIAAAMAEEPTTECASCGGSCTDDPELHADDQFDRYTLREAVGSLLWNMYHEVDRTNTVTYHLMGHAYIENAVANVEPRHLAALWGTCSGMIADAQDRK